MLLTVYMYIFKKKLFYKVFVQLYLKWTNGDKIQYLNRIGVGQLVIRCAWGSFFSFFVDGENNVEYFLF